MRSNTPTSGTTLSQPNPVTYRHSKNPTNWTAGSSEARKLHHHQHRKAETSAVAPMVGSQAGLASQLGMATLGLETEMDIKDTGTKMAVGTLLLTPAIEMVYRLHHQWKNEDPLGDGTIALIPDSHLDPPGPWSFPLCLTTARDPSALTAIALVLGIWNVIVLLEAEAVRRIWILIFPATGLIAEDLHQIAGLLEMIDSLGMTVQEMIVVGEIEMTGM